MATKKEETNNKSIREKMEEKVPFLAFKDNDKYKDDIVVGWNGRQYLIRRGEEVMIPKGVYNIIKRSMDQDNKTYNLMEGLQRSFQDETRKY